MDNKAITVALAVFVVVTVAACGGGDAPTAGSSTQAAAPAGAIDPASITDPGTISGTINFGGAAPEGQLLQMAADPYCITSHAGSERPFFSFINVFRDLFVDINMRAIFLFSLGIRIIYTLGLKRTFKFFLFLGIVFLEY